MFHKDILLNVVSKEKNEGRLAGKTVSEET